jgi:hypothetical protein
MELIESDWNEGGDGGARRSEEKWSIICVRVFSAN